MDGNIGIVDLGTFGGAAKGEAAMPKFAKSCCVSDGAGVVA